MNKQSQNLVQERKKFMAQTLNNSYATDL